MDITLIVMLPPRGAADWSQSAHTLMPVLNVVDVLTLQPIQEVHSQVTGLVHITGIPNWLNLGDFVAAARLVLWQSASDAEVNALAAVMLQNTQMGQVRFFLTETITSATGTLVMKRTGGADPASLPNQKRDELLTTRQTSLTWQQARQVWRHRVSLQTLQQLAGGV